jgi:hypothetical protein
MIDKKVRQKCDKSATKVRQKSETIAALSVLNNNKNIEEYKGNLETDLLLFNTIKKADLVTGGFSKPSKMPGYSYSIPASKCKTGSKLKSVEGSVCYGCYAADDWDWNKQTGRYNNYAWSNVKNAMQRRFDAIKNPMWVPAMIATILKRKCDYFRWHDSGDIQSVEHLENIAKVCRGTPDTNHWIPTREYNTVRCWRDSYDQPNNLCIRASAHMIDGFAPKDMGNSSIVVKGKAPKRSMECEAYKRDAKCGDCRACWSNSVSIIAYPYH